MSAIPWSVVSTSFAQEPSLFFAAHKENFELAQHGCYLDIRAASLIPGREEPLHGESVNGAISSCGFGGMRTIRAMIFVTSGGMSLAIKLEPLVRKPWERPLTPTIGDTNVENTYAGIGRVTSEWENIELVLADLFSLFVGRYQDPLAIQEYGSENVFSRRAEHLCNAATGFFQNHPNQSLEGELDELMGRLREYAQRRHDVAHGVVKPMQWSRSPHAHEESDALHYCVVPPDHKGKDYRADEPAYAYTRAEMDLIANSLYRASTEVIGYLMNVRESVGN